MKNNWHSYYKKIAGRKPNSILKLATQKHLSSKGVAYDMGFGAGDDTKYLLNEGFQVIAVDKEHAAIEFIKTKIKKNDNLTLEKTSFEKIKIMPSNLIFGRASFHFCNQRYFNRFWNKMRISLKKDGILCGTLIGDKFLGDKDTWSTSNGITCISHKDWENLLKKFEILYFDEQEYDERTPRGNKTHWHIYYFILKKI